MQRIGPFLVSTRFRDFDQVPEVTHIGLTTRSGSFRIQPMPSRVPVRMKLVIKPIRIHVEFLHTPLSQSVFPSINDHRIRLKPVRHCVDGVFHTTGRAARN